MPLCTLARLYVVPVCRPFAGWQGLYLMYMYIQFGDGSAFGCML